MIRENPRESAAKKLISIVQLGTIDYATGLRLQQQLVALRKEDKIGDVLLLLEHKPVITLGRNAKAQNVIASRELLAQRGVELFESDRGGDVTFHGPGQLVGYPIFDLRGYPCGADASGSKRKTLGVIEFVRRLEDVLIRACADFTIAAKRVPGLTGVWTDPASGLDQHSQSLPASLSFRAQARNPLSADTTTNASRGTACVGTGALTRSVEQSSTAAAAPEAKLAAIGVHISRFVTSHGFALNVNTDLSYFNLIIPCGITSKPVTSMQKELSRELDINSVAESISRNLGVVFQSQILWIDTLDALLGHTVGVPNDPPKEFREIHGEEDTTWA